MLDFNFSIGLRSDRSDINLSGRNIRNEFEQSYMLTPAMGACAVSFPGRTIGRSATKSFQARMISLGRLMVCSCFWVKTMYTRTTYDVSVT